MWYWSNGVWISGMDGMLYQHLDASSKNWRQIVLIKRRLAMEWNRHNVAGHCFSVQSWCFESTLLFPIDVTVKMWDSDGKWLCRYYVRRGGNGVPVSTIVSTATQHRFGFEWRLVVSMAPYYPYQLAFSFRSYFLGYDPALTWVR